MALRYKQQLNEFDIQTYLFYHLRRRGYVVRGEVAFFNESTGVKGKLDLIVYDHRTLDAALIIEVKTESSIITEAQRSKYDCLGANFVVVKGMKQANNLVRRARNLYDLKRLKESDLLIEDKWLSKPKHIRQWKV